ncbi:protoporphyrinogen/coproporphyrinogen oxidase [Mycolicibacterium fluoranthenivorans]|uniref:Protoporphyrinogen oxidase n=1 Tax=Mycolicibacterium fluoranthenivorans TaxID=258505 RepID=A0A7X5ZEG1_9MYCO|nr:FAD-dependent oxidoreductase [Mycolicibacterium fluoranthenivorans]MCV7354353.1 FAD-dependent oxidoreductase [Mycolicibacterium fluoranthenivorans]NIH97075.1 protoporphyrinogen oxidase [Mycolicibacterium fluoranthenivorans]
MQPTFLVVGAGTTGIGAATRLTELGIDHLVVDAGDRIGGMSASVTDEQGFTWDLGGHVLHSHFPEFDHAVRASGVGINQVTRNGWVWLTGDGPQSLVPTPIQQQLTELPTDLRPDAPAHHLADYYLNHFGRRLYEQFFEPYNRKMWTAPLHEVDHGWTSLRSGSHTRNVPQLGLAGSNPPAPAEAFPYPIGGTGALWQAVQDTLMTPGSTRLGTRVLGLDPDKRVATLDDGSSVSYDYCVSTAPITTALGWIGQGHQTTGLRASRVHAVGLGYRGEPPPALADKTWLYCPDEGVPWYRATMLSNYDPGNAGPGRWNILCEVPSFPGQTSSAADSIGAVQASLAVLGADPARVQSRFAQTIPFGYPVPTLGRDDVLRAADKTLTGYGIYSRGRFGGWRYESSNQDYGYMQGRQAVDHALTGAAEDVYWHPEWFS